MIQTETSELFAKTFSFWDKLTEAQQDKFCRNTHLILYHKGQNIHGGSGECTGGIFVKSGCIRVYILSDEGKEITLYRLYPGEICMLSASCVLQTITLDVMVDAEMESECYIINGKMFADITKTNVYAENYALNLVASRFSDVMWVMQQILFMSFDKRLAIFLYDEMIKTGDEKIQLTQEQIAKYVGSAREVVSRMLKYFASEGIVSYSRGGVVILDKKKLKQLAF